MYLRAAVYSNMDAHRGQRGMAGLVQEQVSSFLKRR
jgi:hypothetical protein